MAMAVATAALLRTGWTLRTANAAAIPDASAGSADQLMNSLWDEGGDPLACETGEPLTLDLQ